MHEVCETSRQAPERHAQGLHTVRIDAKTGRQALERLHPTRERKPGLMARWAYAYARHGTLTLIANCEVASGRVSAPPLGPTRPEDDCARPRAMTLDTDPAAPWIFVADQRNMHQSESVVRLIAARCNLSVDLGVQGHSGIVHSMAPRAACLHQTDHRMRFVLTPKHTSWLHQVERWLSLLARRFLKRASFTSVEDLQKRVLAFIEYVNTTLAQPFQWTYKGRPLAV